MRKILLSMVAGAALLSTGAFAADLPVRGPAVAPAPVFVSLDWAGFYIGAHAGYGWGTQSARIAPADAATAAFVGPVIGVPGGVPANYRTKPEGFLGGVQLGYNWQSGALVYGVEIDGSFGDLNRTANVLPNVVFPSNRFGARVDAMGTARVRLGFAASPALLLYVTGGVAAANVRNTLAVTAANGDAFAGSSSDFRLGWTAGAGAEWAFSRNWSVKAEYLYADIESNRFRAVAAGGACNAANCNINVRTGNLQIHTARIGLNYRFGGPAGAVVAKY